MTPGIIEINDSGIQVAIGKDLVTTSPGYAVLDGEKLLIGQEGLQNSRLLPSWTNNRFWNQLGTDPIANATRAIRHHADLAFAHLESLWQGIEDSVDQVIFLVPGYYDRSQLSLLLGMARECNMRVAGMIDTSLAAAAELSLREVVLHLDIHLHRITLTQISNRSDLARTDFKTITETGIFTFWDRWANIVANQFIQTSRYDPLHEAGSEQELYNQLPEWIASLNDARSKSFNLDQGTVKHSTVIASERLMTACIPIYPRIVQTIRDQVSSDETASLLLSHRFRGFPGLRDALNLIDNIEIIDLPSEQAIHSAVTHADRIIGPGNITHVINLPATSQKIVDDIVKSRRPSHLLCDNHAVSIGHSFKLSSDFTNGIRQDTGNPVCTIYPRGDDLFIEVHVPEILKINGSPASKKTHLQPGDILDVGGQPITLISSG